MRNLPRALASAGHRLTSSLSNRIFLAMALLAVLSIGVASYIVNVTVTRQAEAELQRGLEEAGILVEEYRATLFDHFTREARLVADLPKLKAAVATEDPPTVLPVAADYQHQIAADLFIVTDPAGGILAATGGDPAHVKALEPAIGQARGGRETMSFWARPGEVLQVVSVPIWIDPASPEILGSLSVGFSLDERIAARLKTLTNSEIAFGVDGAIQTSTLPDEYRQALVPLLSAAGVSRLRLGEHDYVAISRSLLSPSAPPLPRTPGVPSLTTAASGVPTAVILRSRTERLHFLSALQQTLLGTAFLAVLAATLLSYAVARSITRPLGAITATMREMAATGDLTRKIALPVRGRQDEDARLLASTFNAMTESISRFQHEAAQRERLSSLGRLSTVLAHEIRNPLMIIRTSLRALRRDNPGSERARAAVADIDEETVRLDRLVNEVLDFARPIVFNYQTADLNALCADAVAASAADDATPPISLRLEPEATDVVTDVERLRIVLVNMLANAQQAVAARQAAAASPAAAGLGPTIASASCEAASYEPVHRSADIEVQTAVPAADRVAIIVRDRGEGIAPEHLPKVFDPYFTTKRTGSGIGLAIARNIIEGLGGSITVASDREGTTFRIELPRRSGSASVPPVSAAAPHAPTTSA